jgi:hypothetical protein
MSAQHGMDTIDSTLLIPIGVSDTFPDGSPSSGMGALGLFNLSIDSANGTAELASLRQTALADVLEVVDITNFLQMSPCYDCAKIGAVSIDADGNLVVSIGIKHPFPAGDPFKPISGKNRGDLHVFNIEGTIVSNLAGYSFAELGETTAGFTLVNADGYTGYLDSVLDGIYPTDATVHPYILHFDDYTAGNFDASNSMGFASVTDPPPSGNLVMAMGCDYDYKDYVFDLSAGAVDFIYAVGCTYAVSTETYSMRFEPEYRIPQHNKKAASEVSVEIITNDLEAGDVLSYALIRVHVVDISHGVAVGENLDEMLADSSVSAITIDAPGIETSILNVDVSSPTGTGHDPSDPLAFGAIMMNTANASEGTYNCLVKVTDSYPSGLNESPFVNGMDGIARVHPLDNPLTGLFDISEFATYQIFTIDVSEQGNIIYVDSSHPGPLYEGTRLNPFLTIQEGIDAALDGFTVKVDDSGTPYEEEVEMKSNIILISENFDDSDGTNRATIDGSDDVEGSNSVLFDNVDNATISGFQIDFALFVDLGGLIEGTNTQNLRIDGGANNTVQDCLFTGMTDMFTVYTLVAVNTTDLVIRNCRFADIDRFEAQYACRNFKAITADNCPGLIVRNNVVTNIRNNDGGSHNEMNIIQINNSDNLILKNNVIYNIKPPTPGLANCIKGYHVISCSNPLIANNVANDLNTSNAFMINQVMAFYIDSYTNATFTDNICSHIHASGFPPPTGRAIQAVYGDEDLVCDYHCMWDVDSTYFSCPAGAAIHGEGCIFFDPEYLDPDNGDYEISASSHAQQGDPGYVDWDDTGAPSGDPLNTDTNTRSRMGCHGGPGGETVGLLT